LPAKILDKIVSFELLEEDTKDRIFWKEESTGTFSLKSEIAFMRQEQRLQPNDSWK